MSTPSRSILVAGDLLVHRSIYEGQSLPAGIDIPHKTSAHDALSGAALLADVLEAVGRRSQAVHVARGFNGAEARAVVSSSYSVFRPFSRGLDKAPQKPKKDAKDREEKVWRISELLGFSEKPNTVPDAVADQHETHQTHDVVVIDDLGLYFSRWPSRIGWPGFLLHAEQPLPQWLIIRMSGPVASGDFWHTLSTGTTQGNPAAHIRNPEELLDRTLIVLSMNDLRAESVLVSRQMSWDRTALELVDEFQKQSYLLALRKCRCVIVTFGSDGAMILYRTGADQFRYRLIFDSNRMERDFQESVAGKTISLQTAFTAALAYRLTAMNAADNGSELLTKIEDGVQRGLCAMRRLMISGYGPVDEKTPAFPFESLAAEIAAPTNGWSYGTAEIPGNRPRIDPWTIIAGDLKSPLFGLARRVAVHGSDQLQQTPYQKFGKLFSIERTEIESLRSLLRLVRAYRDEKRADKPLSLAAFGPPGAGKSFGVKQIAYTILGENVPFLEFNLSQFMDATELHGAFHRVRDEVLQGKLPVVFWDEFDSREYYWLQYLLGPMQDGRFQDDQITHPIGKCIFVFAGGTRHRFEEFGEPLTKDGSSAEVSEDSQREERNLLRLRKAPDFKSRLAGYINVLGPNPRDENDVTYPVRRALLLRTHLKIDDLDVPPEIDHGLLNAFLKIPSYRHGSRSLEKIAEQVRQSSLHGRFTRSDLPPRDQLNLHVDANAFLNLVEQTS